MPDFGKLLRPVAMAVAAYYGGWQVELAMFLGERNRKAASRARGRARDQYNASLKDRLQQLAADPAAARRIALGRVRVGGQALRPAFTTGNLSERLTQVLEFAGHEIDGFEKWYANDVELTLDAGGYVRTAPWLKERLESVVATGTLNTGGGATITLAHVPVGTATAFWVEPGTGNRRNMAVSVVGTTATLSGGPPSSMLPCEVHYQANVGWALMRIRAYTGTATQSVGGDLAAEYGSNMRSTDHYRGIALAVVDCTYDPDVFTAGPPAISALLRGARVYDPRLDSTVGGSGSQREATPSTWTWSQNPSLLARHYARHANGLDVPADEMRLSDTVADAAVCDTSTTFTLRAAGGATSTVTLPRHQCGIVIPSDADPRRSYEEILETMAGRWAWAGGTLRTRAGTLRASVGSIGPQHIWQRQEDESAEPYIKISNGVPREAKVNAVSGRCVDPDQRWQPMPFPAMRDATLIAAEGEYAAEVDYDGVNNIAHAQHLASIAIRESQAPLRMEAQTALSGYRYELFDVLGVGLPRYGMVGKTCEVIGWRWHPEEGTSLRLAEITAAMFEPVSELVGRDPAPNSNLPRPWDVESITGLAVDSGVTALDDGSIIARLQVQWDAATTSAIRSGGQIEVQYLPLNADMPDGDWPSWTEQGASTRAVIPGVLSGVAYLVRARAVQLVPYVRGNWTQQLLHVVAGRRAAIVWRQAADPSADAQDGDTWFDSDAGNLQYLRVSGAWVSVRDSGIAAALSAAADAQATADGKIDTYWQASAPTTAAEGDIWFDTDDGKRQYRRTSGAWVAADDTRIGQAITDAADAQATADGKVRTFVATTAPTAEAVGDLWLDTDDGNRLYRWSGAAWVALPVGTGAIDAGATTTVSVDEYDFAGATFGTGVARTFSVTPAAACTVEFTALVTADNCVGDSGNRISWYVTPAGGAAVLLGGSQTNTTTRLAHTALTAFSAAAGVELVFELRVTRPGGNPAIGLWRSYMRATEIKR